MKKLRIGVTQRVEVVASYGERRDCLDQRWGDLLESLGMWCIPLANRSAELAAEYVIDMQLDGIILSGGNTIGCIEGASGVASERDAFESSLLAMAQGSGMPVLGVCRGMQMLQCFYGGRLLLTQGHAGTRHRLVQSEAGLWPGMDDVNSYHNYGISSEVLPDVLEPLAWSEDGMVEAFRHRSAPWYGIMWHPEREQTVQVDDARLITKLFKGEI